MAGAETVTLLKRLLYPFIDVAQVRPALAGYVRYIQDWRKYSSLEGSEPLRVSDAYPCVLDLSAATPIDAHYFYQDIWAFRAIHRSGVRRHVDVGSRAIYVGMLSAITRVVFVDIRPLIVDLEGYEACEGSILDLPFEDASVGSLSCLHVAEHIGLGRYGDPLDPEGTTKAARELARVVAPGGNLYFSVPVGRPRVAFNAHRIHAPEEVIDMFTGMRLVSFSAVDDHGAFHAEASPVEFNDAEYACGMFHFATR